MDFLILNNQVVSKSEVNLTSSYRNSSFQIEKKIWFGYGGIPLLNENVDQIHKLGENLRLPIPDLLKNKRELFRITKRMLNKNKFYRSGLISIEILWSDEDVNLIISAEPFQQFEFPFREKGILVNFSGHKINSDNQLNRFPYLHSSVWKFSELDIAESPFENSIILNEKGNVCECIGSNFFLIKNKTVYSPALNSGCYEDTIRELVIKTSEELGLKVDVQKTIGTGDLPEMDEIFIAGEETGFHWILGVENKRYLHQYVDLIHKAFDEKLKESTA